MSKQMPMSALRHLKPSENRVYLLTAFYFSQKIILELNFSKENWSEDLDCTPY